MGTKLTKSMREQDSDDEDEDTFTPDQRKKIVLEKIINSNYFKKQKKCSATLNTFAENISSIKNLKKSYLSLDWVKTATLYENNTKIDLKKSNVEEKILKLISSTSIEEEDFDDDEGGKEISIFKEKIDKESEDVKKMVELNGKKLINSIRVKLIIAENVDTDADRSIRMLISPVLSTLHLLPTMGLFHTSLVIGPWIIEWTDSGLVVPRKIISRGAIMTADLKPIETLDKLDVVIHQVAKTIVKWNTRKYYKEVPLSKKYGNCQSFTEDLLKNLGIEMKFSGSIGKYMKELQSKGKCAMKFYIDSEFGKKFGLKDKFVIFKTHEELDKFVIYLINVVPQFSEKYPREWAFFKNFDRAWWLKHNKFPLDRLFTPVYARYKVEEKEMEGLFVSKSKRKSTNQNTVGCPFGDPNEFSFVGENK